MHAGLIVGVAERLAHDPVQVRHHSEKRHAVVSKNSAICQTLSLFKVRLFMYFGLFVVSSVNYWCKILTGLSQNMQGV